MPKNTFPSKRHQPAGLKLLYEDDDVLVVDKAPGLLSVGTETEKVRTAFYRLTDYVRKGNAKSRKRVHVVHRLDREASGILVFAKTPAARERLIDQWATAEKIYLAIVHGKLTKKTGTISTYLIENESYVVRSTGDKKKGKLSHTAYKVIKETNRFSLLEIRLLTGRKNQIRVHLSEIGHPIVGDDKYGKKDKAHKRLALHAKSIVFKHPVSGESISLETAVPEYFVKLIGGKM